LADEWRVVCPDMPGRGESEWLPAKSDYALPTYMADCAALIARLDADGVDWLGTSMGGIIGLNLAAQPGSPIRRVIVNDIGMFIPAEGLSRIASYVGRDPRFADASEAEAYLHQTMATFGIRRPEDWRRITEISTRPAEGGGWRLHYDPGIAEAFAQATFEDVTFWPVWDVIACPVLILRGESSDILPRQTALEMTQRGPKAELVEFKGCGHAPPLLEAEQITVVRQWLAG
jgi:pimeloyl-ACP methyl ester carboxylesterase